jgi:L-alanine-DL-glutamate epimerase-like enolase superfamily enzyme
MILGNLIPIEKLEVSAYTIPTDFPESDGTIEWSDTTIVLVELRGAGHAALGYTYAHAAAATLIQQKVSKLVEGADAMHPPRLWDTMVREVRNIGRPGIASMAISAVDAAVWDLKARALGLPLAQLLGQAHDAVAIYGSGGFTSYAIPQLQDQLRGWAEQGIRAVKMKIGREPDKDLERVRQARAAIGDDIELYVDANGAYSRKQALSMAERFADCGVGWFEEPVSSDDLEGLRLVRDRAPAAMDIAAGEYGFTPWYFERTLNAGVPPVVSWST